jgi:nicotinamide-nucleotide amidase
MTTTLSDTTLLQLAQQVGKALQQQGLQLVTAESCTGGGVAQIMTAIAGSSQWFERGFVTYSNAAKCELLGVQETTPTSHAILCKTHKNLQPFPCC